MCVHLFNRFFIFIWHSVYYSVISQKMCFYLVTGFKFFISKEIKIKIRIEVFYSGNSFTEPCSKEDRIIINFNIFVPCGRVSFEKIGNSLPICSKKIRIRLNALLVRSKKFGIHPKDRNIHSNG